MKETKDSNNLHNSNRSNNQKEDEEIKEYKPKEKKEPQMPQKDESIDPFDSHIEKGSSHSMDGSNFEEDDEPPAETADKNLLRTNTTKPRNTAEDFDKIKLDVMTGGTTRKNTIMPVKKHLEVEKPKVRDHSGGSRGSKGSKSAREERALSKGKVSKLAQSIN